MSHTSTRNRSLRAAQKARRRERLAAIDLGAADTRKQPHGTARKDVFVPRTVRATNHPRRNKGYRRWKRSEAVKAQEAIATRQAENRERLAGMKARGEPLPGQRPGIETVRK